MKLIHCADLHLDSRMSTHLSKEQARERRSEMLRTFTRMVDYADQDGARVILIAGDLFDTRNCSATARNVVLDAITSHPQMDFLYLRGNHGVDAFLSRLAEVPENLKLFGEDWTTYRYGKVAITGMEMPQDGRALPYYKLNLERNVYNIVVLHGPVAETGDGSAPDVISLNALRGKNIDYLALGHYHEYRRDKLDARGIYCYSGCLEGRGFDECGTKGFVRLDVDERTCRARMKFVAAAHRTMYTLPVDVSGVMTSQEAARQIEAALATSAIPQKSMVRIELTGEVDVDSEINCEFLQDMFTEYFYYEMIVDRTRMRVDYSAYEKDVSLKGEFVRTVMRSDMDEEKKAQVIRSGILALSGEEM